MQNTTYTTAVQTQQLPQDIFLGIDCWEAEKRLKTTSCSEYALNALAIDEPLEYARLYLEGKMQIWVDAEDSLELW